VVGCLDGMGIIHGVPPSSAAYRDDACELLIGRHGCVGLHVAKGRLFNGK